MLAVRDLNGQSARRYRRALPDAGIGNDRDGQAAARLGSSFRCAAARRCPCRPHESSGDPLHRHVAGRSLDLRPGGQHLPLARALRGRRGTACRAPSAPPSDRRPSPPRFAGSLSPRTYRGHAGSWRAPWGLTWESNGRRAAPHRRRRRSGRAPGRTRRSGRPGRRGDSPPVGGLRAGCRAGSSCRGSYSGPTRPGTAAAPALPPAAGKARKRAGGKPPNSLISKPYNIQSRSGICRASATVTLLNSYESSAGSSIDGDWGVAYIYISA